MSTITVALNPPYDITVEPGIIGRLGEVVRAVAPADRVMLIVDRSIEQTHGARADAALRAAGYDVQRAGVIAEEGHKSLDAARSLYESMLRARLDRTSPVVAAGGGITGDIAGFAAATFLRGLPVIHVPTTLLAMVDASIGGKTGVNFPLPDGGLGKNLVGAFYQPRAVFADPQALRTLDPREFRCGLAECIKHAMIADADLLEFLSDHLKEIVALDMDALATLIERSARIKAGIVSEDERETGRRALLNLGHTFGHAIESLEALQLKHGEAVAIGLCAASRCSVLTNRMTESEAAAIESLLGEVGLPRRLPNAVDTEALISAMGHDKKIERGKLRLILPRGLGRAEIVGDVPRETILRSLIHVGAAAR